MSTQLQLPIVEEVRGLANAAGLDPHTVDWFVANAPVGWTGDAQARLGDLALLSPGLPVGTIRVRIEAPAADERWELTVVAPDRAGLLSATAKTCFAHHLSIHSARIASWPARVDGAGSEPAFGLALQRLRVEPLQVERSGEPDWNSFGLDLRQALAGSPTAASAVADPLEFTISSVEDLGDGTHRVVVSAPDRPGLLASITRTLLDAGADILSADVYTSRPVPGGSPHTSVPSQPVSDSGVTSSGAPSSATGTAVDVFVLAGVSSAWFESSWFEGARRQS